MNPNFSGPGNSETRRRLLSTRFSLLPGTFYFVVCAFDGCTVVSKGFAVLDPGRCMLLLRP